MYRRIIMLCLFVFASPSLWADVTGQYRVDGGGSPSTVTIYYRDAGNIRFETGSGGGPGSILVKGDKVYAMTPGGYMDLSEMGAMMSQFGMQGSLQGHVDEVEEGEIGLKSTGRHKTVAGIQGEVYRYTLTRNGQVAEQGEVTLTTDGRARQLQEAMKVFATKVAQSMGAAGPELSAQSMQAIEDKVGGKAILEVEGMTLLNVKEGAIAADRFELSGQKMSMPSFGGGMPRR